MSEQENKDLVQRFYDDVLTGGQLDLIDKLAGEDFVDHEGMPGQPTPVQGRENMKEFIQEFHNAFPDLEVTVNESIAEGDRVTVRSTWAGTHEGALFGIEPSNQPVEFTCIDIVRIEDGLAREHWGLTDNLTLFSQIGAINPPQM